MPDTVLFACVKNGGRSVICERLFNELADPTKVRAVSAGSAPGGGAHPVVVDVLREEGIDATDHVPQKLTPELAASSKLLVTMGCGESTPEVPGLETQNWGLEDPKHMPPEQARQVRDAAKACVQKLISQRGWGREAS